MPVDHQARVPKETRKLGKEEGRGRRRVLPLQKVRIRASSMRPLISTDSPGQASIVLARSGREGHSKGTMSDARL